ncbi:hypothetical protein [Flagellimonas flava]|uniref:hypothetical protein n=1 Tax=Flagellimonas flava TaxID=570519 RepID=UPI003D652FFE
MALNKETLAWIAELTGVKAEDITAKIESGNEEGLEKPQGEFFTDDDLSKRDSSKYREGKEAGSEMLVKDLKKEYGYEFDGKDVKSFMSHHDSQLKTKYSKDSNSRVEELEKDLSKQKETYEEEITGYKTQLAELSGKYRGETVRNTLLSIMPKETTIKPDAIVTLFKSEYQVEEEEGVLVVKKNGETLKDSKTASPLELQNVFNEYIEKEGYSKGQSGRGGVNDYGSGGNVAKDLESFQDQWKSQNPGKSTGSPEYQKDYAEWRNKSKAA